jgi:Uncharacterised nucleotidyltransferase
MIGPEETGFGRLMIESPETAAAEPGSLPDSHSCALLLALACQLVPTDGEAINRLIANIQDWEPFFLLAQEHRLLPMLFPRLAEMGVAVPPAIAARLEMEYRRNALHCLANAAELISLLGEFERASIRALPFKGIVLALSAYGDLAARQAGDLDLLIHHGDLPRAAPMLLARGYSLLTPIDPEGVPTIPNFEYSFERPTDGMVVELRWRLQMTLPGFDRELGLDWVWPSHRVLTLAGAQVPCMSPEMMLLVLCLHAAKHVWSRLLWICDVARLMGSSPELNWDRLLSAAKKNGLTRALAVGTILAHRVCGAAVPEKILRRFESDRSSVGVARHVQGTLFAAPGSLPNDRMPYYFRMLDFRDRVRYAFSGDFLRPVEKDRDFIVLPKPLHPLYYVIRPIRLLRDRSAR